MFSKPLDPRLKAKIYDNLRVNPEANIHKLCDAYVKDVQAGSFDTAKEAIKVLKFMIKDKVSAKPKFYALLLIKELMETGKKTIVEYFIKKLMSRFFLIAQFEQKNPDIKRGQRCLKKYFDANDQENLEFSQKFLMLLLECWKHWDRMFSAEYKKIKEKCDKLKPLFPINDLFYNQLESHQMLESGVHAERAYRTPAEPDNADYQFHNSLDHNSLPSFDLTEDNRPKVITSKVQTSQSRADENVRGARKLIAEFIREGRDVFDANTDRMSRTLDTELTLCNKLALGSSGKSTLDLQTRISLAKEIEVLSDIRLWLESYINGDMSFEEFKKTFSGEGPSVNTRAGNFFPSIGNSHAQVDDERSATVRLKVPPVDSVSLSQRVKPQSERNAKRVLETGNPLKTSIGKSVDGPSLGDNPHPQDEFHPKKPVTTFDDNYTSKKPGNVLKGGKPPLNNKRRNSDNIRPSGQPSDKAPFKNQAQVQAPITKSNDSDWNVESGDPQWNFDDEKPNPQTKGLTGDNVFRTFQNFGSRANESHTKPPTTSNDHSPNPKHTPRITSESTFMPGWESDAFNQEPTDAPLGDYIAEHFGNNDVFDAFESDPHMPTIQEESREDYDESRKSHSRFGDNPNGPRRMTRSQLDASKRHGSLADNPNNGIKFDDFIDFDVAEAHSKNNSSISKTITQSDHFISGGGRNQRKLATPTQTPITIKPYLSVPPTTEFGYTSEPRPKLGDSTKTNPAFNNSSGPNGARRDGEFRHSANAEEDSMEQTLTTQPLNPQRKNILSAYPAPVEPNIQKFENGKKNAFAKRKNLKLNTVSENSEDGEARHLPNQNDDPFNFMTPQEPRVNFFDSHQESRTKSHGISPNGLPPSSHPSNHPFFKSEGFENFAKPAQDPVATFDPFAIANKPPSQLPSPQNLPFNRAKRHSNFSDKSMEPDMRALNPQFPPSESQPTDARRLKELSMSSIENTHKSKFNMIQTEMNARVSDPINEFSSNRNTMGENLLVHPEVLISQLEFAQPEFGSNPRISTREPEPQGPRSSDAQRHLMHTFAKAQPLQIHDSDRQIDSGRGSAAKGSDAEYFARVSNSFEARTNFQKKQTATFEPGLGPQSDQFDSNKLLKPNFDESPHMGERISLPREKEEEHEREHTERSTDAFRLESLKYRNRFTNNPDVVVKVRKAIVNHPDAFSATDNRLSKMDTVSRDLLEKESIELKVHNEFLRQQCELLLGHLASKDSQAARLKGLRGGKEADRLDQTDSDIIESIETKLVQRKNQLLMRENDMLVKINKELVTQRRNGNFKKLEENNLYKQLNKELQFYTEELKRELEGERSRKQSFATQGVQSKLGNVSRDIEEIREMHQSLVAEVREQSSLAHRRPPLPVKTDNAPHILQELSETTSFQMNSKNSNRVDFRKKSKVAPLDVPRLSMHLVGNRSPMSREQELVPQPNPNAKVSEMLKVSYLEDPGLPVPLSEMKSSQVLYRNSSMLVAPSNPNMTAPSNLLSHRDPKKARSFHVNNPALDSHSLNLTDRSLSIYKIFFDEIESRKGQRNTSNTTSVAIKKPKLAVPRTLNANLPVISSKALHAKMHKAQMTLSTEQSLPSHRSHLSSLTANLQLHTQTSLDSYLPNHPGIPVMSEAKLNDFPINDYIDLRDFPLYAQPKNLFLLKACSLFNRSLLYENDLLRVFCTTEQRRVHSTATEVVFKLTFNPKSYGYLLSSSLQAQSEFTAVPKAYIGKSLSTDLTQEVTFLLPAEVKIVDFPALLVNLRSPQFSQDLRIPLPFSINKFASKSLPSKDFVVRYLDNVS